MPILLQLAWLPENAYAKASLPFTTTSNSMSSSRSLGASITGWASSRDTWLRAANPSPVILHKFITICEIVLWLPCVMFRSITKPFDQILFSDPVATLHLAVIQKSLNFKFQIVFQFNWRWRGLYPTIRAIRL